MTTAAPPPEPIETPAKQAAPARLPPAAPQTPPPEKQWHEELCSWRPRDAADPYEGDHEYTETIHRYDPLERADEEDDYDWDD